MTGEGRAAYPPLAARTAPTAIRSSPDGSHNRPHPPNGSPAVRNPGQPSAQLPQPRAQPRDRPDGSPTSHPRSPHHRTNAPSSFAPRSAQTFRSLTESLCIALLTVSSLLPAPDRPLPPSLRRRQHRRAIRPSTSRREGFGPRTPPRRHSKAGAGPSARQPSSCIRESSKTAACVRCVKPSFPSIEVT